MAGLGFMGVMDAASCPQYSGIDPRTCAAHTAHVHSSTAFETPWDRCQLAPAQQSCMTQESGTMHAAMQKMRFSAFGHSLHITH